MANKIAQNETFEYWRIGNEVYRRAVSAYPPALDVTGIPMDLRWECEYLHYCRFAIKGLYPLPTLENLAA